MRRSIGIIIIFILTLATSHVAGAQVLSRDDLKPISSSGSPPTFLSLSEQPWERRPELSEAGRRPLSISTTHLRLEERSTGRSRNDEEP